MNVENAWGKWLKYIPLVLFLLVAALVASTYNAEALSVFLHKYEKFALIISLLVYLFLSVTPIPTEPVALLVLAWKGPVIAILMATLGNTLSALVEYYIGGSIGGLTDFEKRREKLPFHLGRFPINSPVFLILARMLPAVGPKVVSVAGGMYQVPLFTYLWTAIVANLVGAALLVGGGWGLINLIR